MNIFGLENVGTSIECNVLFIKSAYTSFYIDVENDHRYLVEYFIAVAVLGILYKYYSINK